MNRYTRKQVAEKCQIHPNTVYRLERDAEFWSKLGVSVPRRLKHNRQLIYYDEHIDALKKYFTEEVAA